MKDYYQILGVSRDASQEEIKSSFRRLARDTHPDANPGNPEAEARFRDIAEAYEVLSDARRRAAYDRGETVGEDLFSQFGGLDEILQQFFGGGFGFGGQRRGPRQGQDVSIGIQLTLDEAAVGVSRDIEFVAPVRCDVCAGSGAAPGTAPVRCATCGGAGRVQVSRNTFMGSMMTLTECGTCRGSGTVIADPCSVCRGIGRIDDAVTLAVEIPAGVDDGTRLRLSGKGGAGDNAAPGGDLYVHVRVAGDERFSRLGDDLHHRVRLGVTEAALGTEVTIPLIGGEETDIDIPAGTQPGAVFRLGRQGMPRLRRRGRGDLLVEVDVVVPTDLTPDQEAALRSYAEMRGEQPADGKRKRRFRTG